MTDNYWTRRYRNGISRRRFFGGAALGGAGLASLALVGCGNDDDDTGNGGNGGNGNGGNGSGNGGNGDVQRGGTFRVGNPEVTGLFEPNLSVSGADWAIMFGIYDTLFVTDEAGTIMPKLATAFEPNDGQLVLTLQEGVTFHDGTPFNASAVQRNVERTLGMGESSRIYSQWQQIESVEAPDDQTVVFTLTSPQYGPIVANMATISGAMPSPDAVEERGDDFAASPVGSGPYQIDRVVMDSQVTMIPYADYWSPDEGPFLDGVNFQIIPDPAAQITSMQAGELDLIHYSVAPNASLLQQLEGTSGVEVQRLPAHSFSEFRLYLGAPPFDNPDLVKALGYAIDRTAILHGINNNWGSEAGGPINPATWAWDPDFEGYFVDPDAREGLVRQHLEAAGMPDGFAFTSKTPGGAQSRVEAIAQQVAPYGIELNIEILPSNADLGFLYEGNFHVYPSATPMYSPDPDSIFRPNFHSDGQFNYHEFSNAELDELIDRAGEETDQEARVEMYQEAQRVVFEAGMPRIPQVFPDILVPVRDTVRGLRIGWESYARVGGVWLDQ